jgi:cyclase
MPPAEDLADGWPGERTRRTLIVARMDATDESKVAEIFAESDAGELPRQVGVRRRDLFSFHGLYFHLIEATTDIAPRLEPVRDNRLFADVNTKLAAHIAAYDPVSWRGPADAMAHSFYTWLAD